MSDVNLLQHEALEKDIEGLTTRLDEQYQNWGNFLESQERRSREFEDRFFAETKELRGGIDRKVELDSALMTKMGELTRRVEYLAEKKEKADEAQRYLVMYFREIRDILKAVDLRKMKIDLEAAHAWKREHEEHHKKTLEPRIESLETRGGKAATRILWGIALPVGGGLMLFLLQKLWAFVTAGRGTP